MMLSGCFPFFSKGNKAPPVVLPSAFESWDWGEDEGIMPSSGKNEEEKVMEEEIITVVVKEEGAEGAETERRLPKEEEGKTDADLPFTQTAPDSDPQQKSATVTTRMMADTKTHFPTFFDLDELELLSQDDFMDGNDSDDECDDDLILEDLLQDKYRNKEDADVEVFLRIADRMSLTSLLHLLQGHVRAKNMCLPAVAPKKEPKEQETQQQQQQQPQRRQMFATKVTRKKFRWARDSNYKIRAQVHSIEPIKEMKDLWWTTDEFNTIRKELLKTITVFSKFKQGYLTSLEIVCRGEQPQAVLEANMKELTRDSYARGLEGHMIPLVKQTRTRLAQRVLRQQVICQRRGDDNDKKCDCLRNQSLLHTTVLAGFAERMGQCDEIEALTANMSTWEPVKE